MMASLSSPSGRRIVALWVCLIAVDAVLLGSACGAQRRGVRAGSRVRAAKRLQVYRNRHDKLRQSFVRDLGEIAKYCNENGLTKEAQGLRKVVDAIGTSKLTVAPLPSEVQPDLPRNLPRVQREWRIRYRSDLATGMRIDYEGSLYDIHHIKELGRREGLLILASARVA